MVTTSVNLTTNCYAGRSDDVTLIGIHTMEAPEAGDTAENVANYFKNPAVQASAHWCVDSNSRVRCVQDSDCAWTMPPTNGYSLNVEIAGYAAQTATQWQDAYSVSTLDVAALCCAEWCINYEIPVRRLTDTQIAAKAKGLAGHVDVNRVFHGSDHTDPGPNFPWIYFLNRVETFISLLKGTTPQVPLSTKPNCTLLQKAVRAVQDNLWGPEIDKRCNAVFGASDYAGGKFPYGIQYTQSVIGTQQDGIWGLNSKTALQHTTAAIQEALHDMGFEPGFADGIWGPSTSRAYSAARSSCHI